MKNLVFNLFILTLLLGCGSPPESKETSAPKEEPLEWLTFGGDQQAPHVVLVSGDEEYRSEEALPQLAKILSNHHGFNCTVLFAQDPENPGIVDPNYLSNIPGLEQLKDADMMIIFTRFRALPDDQMKHIDDYLKTGKPVLGIRTATHAFNFNDVESTSYAHYGNYYQQEDTWKDGFGRLVLGEKWISHHGDHAHQSTRGVPAPGAENHPILNGIEEGQIWGPTDVYGVRLPLPGDSEPIVMGQVVKRAGDFDENDPRLGMRPTDNELPGLVEKKVDDETLEINQNDPMMPIAWTKSYQLPEGQSGKVFATTIGASTDLLEEGTRRLLVNGVFWLLEMEVPEKAQVDLVGDYSPSRFAFQEDEYWDQKNLKISDLQ
jgi:hypothetical protein